MTEMEKQLSSLSIEINNYQTSEKQMINEIEQLKTQNAEQEVEKDNIIRKIVETEEQLATVRTRMLNEIEQLQKENATLQIEKEKIVTHIAGEIQQLSSSLTEVKNYQISQQETLIRIKELTEQITEQTKQNNLLEESLKVEQNARRETEEQLKDFLLLKERNNVEVIFTEYTRAELKEVTNGFSKSLKIGEGGYGPVYKAFLGLKPVAIKILKYENRHGNEQFNQEVDILSTIRHPNLVMLLGACQETQALVYELMPNGSLYDMLRNKQTPNALTAKRRICIASNICSALIFLHSAKPHGIVHGDLKPANILLDSNYMGKLSDFGICRHLEKIDMRDTAFHYTETLKGTRPYMDPECFSEGEMTAQYDVYSFGIILLELVTGRDPKGLRDEVKQAFKTGKIFVDASAGEWPLEEASKMVHLGLRCSEFSRKERPNLEKEVLPEIESMLRASLRF